MKKTVFAAALLAAITFSSCSDNSSANTEATADMADMSHDAMHADAMPTSVVVETPDFADVAEPVKAQVAQLLDQYLKLKDALVAADASAAKDAAEKVVALADAVPVASMTEEQKAFASEKIAKVKESASQMAATSDVEAQREHLEPLSEATFAMTKAFNAASQTLYYQHCPMANNNEGGYWVSASEEIRNPYLGDKMMTCGSNEEVLQ